MNKIIFCISSLFLIFLVSCDNRENVEGQWQSDPIKLDLPNTATSSATLVMTFSQDGNVSLNSNINLTEPMPLSQEVIAPYAVSVSATASIEGKWRYASGENDEVLISFDFTSFAVNIDPDAVIMAENTVDGQEAPKLEVLKSATIAKYNVLLTSEMRTYFSSFSKLDDIKAKNSVLTFEIEGQNGHDQHITLHEI